MLGRYNRSVFATGLDESFALRLLLGGDSGRLGNL